MAEPIQRQGSARRRHGRLEDRFGGRDGVDDHVVRFLEVRGGSLAAVTAGHNRRKPLRVAGDVSADHGPAGRRSGAEEDRDSQRDDDPARESQPSRAQGRRLSDPMVSAFAKTYSLFLFVLNTGDVWRRRMDVLPN